MSRFLLAMVLAFCCIPLAARSAEPARKVEEPRSELTFLESGRDYVIRFAEGSNLFKTTKAGITPTSYTTSDGETKQGKPATWSMTVSVTTFHVVRLGGGSWVLLRHAADSEDFAKWDGQRRALAILASDRRDEIASEPDGEERLAKLQEAADREIATTETWVNLNHALAIAEVPTEDVKLKLSIKSIKQD